MSNFSLDPSLYGEEHKPPVLAGIETYAQQAPMPHQHPLHQYSYQHQNQHQHQHQQTPQPAPMSADSSAVLTDGAMPPQSDVDEFLRKKRKAREHKACYPCRQRKVKCDLSRPCQTCRDREHPELCSYHPPNKRQNVEQSGPSVPQMPKGEEGLSTAANTANVVLSRGDFDMLFHKLSGLENQMADLRREIARNSSGREAEVHDPALYQRTPENHIQHEPLPGIAQHLGQRLNGDTRQPFQQHTRTHGVHTKNPAGQIIHFGAASIPAFLAAMRDGNSENNEIQELLGRSVLPMFGLDDESATYPFVDLWGLPHGSLQRAQELAKALPSDSQMLSMFRYYRDLAHVIYPGIVHMDLLEQDLNRFLATRAAQASKKEGVTEQSVYGRDFHWLGLLFAVIASGAQSSETQRKERELTSQVYICCAMECLRFVNFLSQANLETIETLLIIQNVLANNMNAGTAWAMHGLTIRLAQGLGLHHPCPPNIPLTSTYPRSRLWWNVVWQDSLLSIIYDRASGATTAERTTMPMPMQFGQVSEYHSTMYSLVKVGLEIVRDRGRASEMSTQEVYDKITQHRDAISQIMRDSAEYLRDSRQCTSPLQTLEHWALYMHTSYTISELCRPAISPRYASKELVITYKPLCVENLINTVEAFLGLNGITAYARQSWAAIHRGLGSALLLGILGEHNKNERARQLLARFINAIHDITTNVDPQEIAAPLQRGISALRRLNIHEAVGSHPAEAQFSDGVGLDEITGGLKIEPGMMYTTPNSVADTIVAGDEHSPYSVLNTILWGTADARGGVGTGFPSSY